ncbi:MAG: twin-arginine translocase subunit TatB, partial [Gammaproteobacteria bacterium]|nr:twin-arginine translocase subunit TatB [Gammaproteobacteria bacterium]
MFDVGFWEILMILILALVVIGPERLPGAARTLGLWVGKGRRYIEGV